MRRFALLIVLALTLPLGAEDFWVKKPYTDWSKQEVERLLKNSPWAQGASLTQVNMMLANQESVNSTPTLSSTDAATNAATTGRDNTHINYTAMLASALPIRQALVRQQLIANNVSAMPPDQQRALMEKAEQFLSAPVNDVVLVHVLYGSNNQQFDRMLAGFWQHQSLDTLKNSTVLIGANGKRVPPNGFQASPGAGRDFELSFPRTVDGEPILTANDKVLALEFRAPGLSIGGAGMKRNRGRGATQDAPGASGTPNGGSDDSDLERIYVPFRPKDMLLKGELVY